MQSWVQGRIQLETTSQKFPETPTIFIDVFLIASPEKVCH